MTNPNPQGGHTSSPTPGPGPNQSNKIHMGKSKHHKFGESHPHLPNI